MSCLGKYGRFGNQVFQYAFLKIYALRYSLGVETDTWVGGVLFGHRDPPLTHQLPLLETNPIFRGQTIRSALFSNDDPPYYNVDLRGQYMFHTRLYRPYKPYFRSLFQPTPEILSKVKAGLDSLRSKGKTIVGIHIRRGDYLKHRNHPRNFPTPTSWYRKWLDQVWPTLEKPVLFVASDSLDSVLPDFKSFHPITSADLIQNFPKNTSYRSDPSFYPDFYLLTQCDLLAISNSSFSFSASLLNEKGKTFLRPHPDQKLVPYNPWDSDVRLNFWLNKGKQK